MGANGEVQFGGRGVILETSKRSPMVDGASAMLGVLNPDLGQAMVHRPTASEPVRPSAPPR